VAELTYQMFRSCDGTSIAYRVIGEGQPVVLVHGLTLTSSINFSRRWKWNADCTEVEPAGGPTVEGALVEAGLKVVMLDLRGHGHSEKPHDPRGYDMEIFADDVRALAAHLNLGRAAVVGYSLGSMIAGHLLAEEWVSCAALCGMASFSGTRRGPRIASEIGHLG
jgi:pimeloyl-ACP methyl ester carboxylesterase